MIEMADMDDFESVFFANGVIFRRIDEKSEELKTYEMLKQCRLL